MSAQKYNVYYIGVIIPDRTPRPAIRPGETPPASKAVQLCAVKNVSSFSYFTRSTAAEFLSFFSKIAADYTFPGAPRELPKELYKLNCIARTEGVAVVVGTDFDYPQLAAQGLCRTVLDDFLNQYPKTVFEKAGENGITWKKLDEYLEKYQNPMEADKILKIQAELDSTKTVLNQTIEELLGRGAKIDELVSKSTGLSTQSKMFYTQAKKQNSCCTVM